MSSRLFPDALFGCNGGCGGGGSRNQNNQQFVRRDRQNTTKNPVNSRNNISKQMASRGGASSINANSSAAYTQNVMNQMYGGQTGGGRRNRNA